MNHLKSSKLQRRAKRLYALCVCLALTAAMFVMPAFAASGGNGLNSLQSLNDLVDELGGHGAAVTLALTAASGLPGLVALALTADTRQGVAAGSGSSTSGIERDGQLREDVFSADGSGVLARRDEIGEHLRDQRSELFLSEFHFAFLLVNCG